MRLSGTTFKVSRQPKPQWGQVVSTRRLCQILLFTGLSLSVSAPTGHSDRHSAAGDTIGGIGGGDPGINALALEVDGESSGNLPAGMVASAAEDAPQFPVTDERRGIGLLFILPERGVFGRK